MDEVHAIVERQRPNQVVLQIGLGELGSRTALRLADCRLLGIDPDATEVHNHAPVFSTQPLGTAKVEIIGRALERRRRDPAGRRWVQGYFPDALGAAALRRVSVVSCAVDSYADRRNVMVAARAVGVPVVDVGGLDDTGQVTVYGASPEAACIECEIGGSHLGALDRLPALTRSGCGDPHQGPSAWIADRIATE